MIFGDPRYETLVMIVATVGIGLGAIIASVRGTGMGLVAFGFQILIGVGLFVGLIATTGKVHVYDRVRNAYQTVGGVPNRSEARRVGEECGLRVRTSGGAAIIKTTIT